jgi:hypothetical protein
LTLGLLIALVATVVAAAMPVLAGGGTACC